MSSLAKPKSRMKTFFKFLMIFLVVIAIAGVASHFAWKQSGSNQWELEHEINGVKVYSLKAPGAVLKLYKVVGRFQAKLGPIMKVMRDPAACDDVGCYESYIIEKPDYPRFVTYTFRYPMPSPFKPREYVVLSEFHQDSTTKEIYVDYKTVTDKLPLSDCCVRVPHMHNKWRFTPMENGDVQVEFIMDHDPGGFVPYFVVNAGMSESIHTNIPELQAVLDKDKYKDAVVEYVQEVGQVAHIETEQESKPL
ncbi:MAG: hypothetical protein EOO43_20150 [Flavobacterium sp.]|nr:MAG: hypothetical protein EOO43_20150 [Flavobacterium sp.]